MSAELESIPSLNNLEIIHDEGDYIEFTEAALEDSEAGPAVFPDHAIFSLRFDLYIPFRIQRNIVGEYFNSETETEKFRIHIHYPYHTSVVLVELLDGGESLNPSTAVRIVREYLQTEINRLSSKLAFKFLGPSPFHADFWIEGYNTPNDAKSFFECNLLKSLGYANITFRCCVENAEFKEHACEILLSELEHELDQFYNIRQSIMEDYHSWEPIETVAAQLFDQLGEKHDHQPFAQTFTRGRDLSKLNMELSKFEVEYIQRHHYAEKQCRELYARHIPGFLRTIVESELEDRPVFPIKQMKELVMFIESRRSKAIELLIVLIAALIAGVTGSVITLLFSSGN